VGSAPCTTFGPCDLPLRAPLRAARGAARSSSAPEFRPEATAVLLAHDRRRSDVRRTGRDGPLKTPCGSDPLGRHRPDLPQQRIDDGEHFV
ncbi:hypothetical protein, partial [Streptomyces sp. NPDC059015]|uniref:hypothetical protein n=1 Tax=Streptomyces sp. NPDC059015 TaxID=3346698 RepID=UPI00369982EA